MTMTLRSLVVLGLLVTLLMPQAVHPHSASSTVDMGLEDWKPDYNTNDADFDVEAGAGNVVFRVEANIAQRFICRHQFTNYEQWLDETMVKLNESESNAINLRRQNYALIGTLFVILFYQVFTWCRNRAAPRAMASNVIPSSNDEAKTITAEVKQSTQHAHENSKSQPDPPPQPESKPQPRSELVTEEKILAGFEVKANSSATQGEVMVWLNLQDHTFNWRLLENKEPEASWDLKGMSIVAGKRRGDYIAESARTFTCLGTTDRETVCFECESVEQRNVFALIARKVVKDLDREEEGHDKEFPDFQFVE